ncbi:TPA: transcriptional repressor [Candidatus Poribacteria bacterium]|nr:transcriptional repressor [Candidatus Poribacteria bacterium]
MSTNNDELITAFKAKGYRITKQRLIILNALRNTATHPTAEEIYNMVKPQIPNISLGTVYRTLGALEELGLLQKLVYGGSFSRYDGNVNAHYHAVCLDCGKVLDVDEPVLSNLEERFSSETGFTIVGHKLEFHGYCKDCCKRKN